MNTEMRHLRYFVALAEEEHFSRAAARCRVSQPTLTRAVAALERSLGVRLVQRTTRSVALTDAGHRLHAELTELLPRMEAAFARVRADAGLRLGFTWLLPSGIVGRILTDFEAATGVPVELVRRDDRLAGVDVGAVDAALLHGTVDDPALAPVRLRSEERVAVVARDHPLGRRRRLQWTELAGLPLVVNSVSGTVGPELWPAECRPAVAVECATYDAWMEMVALGRGFGVLPESARRHPHPGVRYISLADAPPVPLVLVLPARAAHPLADELTAAARTAAASAD
ncbi:LysR family transcriptional regulator [Streptomyces tropicalis]|uniref:LysR substrate-binding domain-containing protein n=1 Tax=Streptomyces tropicalis TaxID=3034234 RepID=A0ABT6A3M4_9ACTN|nr:LysR substrate-binding domain-containing protein [Streptomyces tropicalis]MDF3299245.1 LysR substrate-binding domain-containing protein [Streptomyces tropicalis]